MIGSAARERATPLVFAIYVLLQHVSLNFELKIEFTQNYDKF